MEVTEQEEFLVHEQDTSSPFASSALTHFWFEVLEGPDAGMRVRIPATPNLYSEEMFQRLQQLESGDVVEAVLEREDRSASWMPREFEVVSKL